MFKVSFLLPTIRDKYIDVMRTWDDDDVEFLLSYDVQNINLRRLTYGDIASFKGNVRIYEHNCAELGGNVPVWNYLAAEAKGDVIYPIADDLWNTTPNWRNMLLEYAPQFLSGAWAFVGDDMLRCLDQTTWERKLAGHPCLSRQYYELFGYVWYTGYKSQWCDNEFYYVGTAINRLLYIPEIVYENRHVVAGLAEPDQWCRLQEQTHGYDHSIWQQKERINSIVTDIRSKLYDEQL